MGVAVAAPPIISLLSHHEKKGYSHTDAVHHPQFLTRFLVHSSRGLDALGAKIWGQDYAAP